MQAVGFLGPAVFLLALSTVTDPVLAVACLVGAQVRLHLGDLFIYFILFSMYKEIRREIVKCTMRNSKKKKKTPVPVLKKVHQKNAPLSPFKKTNKKKQFCDAFSQAGLYSNHQDIGPRYAGVLLGLSNTAGELETFFHPFLKIYLLFS